LAGIGQLIAHALTRTVHGTMDSDDDFVMIVDPPKSREASAKPRPKTSALPKNAKGSSKGSFKGAGQRSAVSAFRYPCPICTQDISKLDIMQRESHVNACCAKLDGPPAAATTTGAITSTTSSAAATANNAALKSSSSVSKQQSKQSPPPTDLSKVLRQAVTGEHADDKELGALRKKLDAMEMDIARRQQAKVALQKRIRTLTTRRRRDKRGIVTDKRGLDERAGGTAAAAGRPPPPPDVHEKRPVDEVLSFLFKDYKYKHQPTAATTTASDDVEVEADTEGDTEKEEEIEEEENPFAPSSPGPSTDLPSLWRLAGHASNFSQEAAPRRVPTQAELKRVMAAAPHFTPSPSPASPTPTRRFQRRPGPESALSIDLTQEERTKEFADDATPAENFTQWSSTSSPQPMDVRCDGGESEGDDDKAARPYFFDAMERLLFLGSEVGLDERRSRWRALAVEIGIEGPSFNYSVAMATAEEDSSEVHAALMARMWKLNSVFELLITHMEPGDSSDTLVEMMHQTLTISALMSLLSQSATHSVPSENVDKAQPPAASPVDILSPPSPSPGEATPNASTTNAASHGATKRSASLLGRLDTLEASTSSSVQKKLLTRAQEEQHQRQRQRQQAALPVCATLEELLSLSQEPTFDHYSTQALQALAKGCDLLTDTQRDSTTMFLRKLWYNNTARLSQSQPTTAGHASPVSTPGRTTSAYSAELECDVLATLTGDAATYEKILSFQPVDLDALYHTLSHPQSGVTVSKKVLKAILDDKNILNKSGVWNTANKTATSNGRKRGKK